MSRAAIKKAGGNRRKAINLGLRRMRSNGLITDADQKRLEQVNLIVFQVEGGKQSPEKASARLDALYRESLDDPAASEMGSASGRCPP